jgi:tRNA(fMet)-specific endonuclease VapC
VETELWAGVYHSGGKIERLKVEKLLGTLEILQFDRRAAEASGRILGELGKAGRRIGDFDTQIAGHAIALHAHLVTKNPRHFSRVPGLKLLVW